MARNRKKGAISAVHKANGGSLSHATTIEADGMPSPTAQLREESAQVPKPTNDGSLSPASPVKVASLQTGKNGTNKGKNGGKVAPLPPGFLESELTLHKRKLKTAEHQLNTSRHEVADLKQALASLSEENRELRECSAAMLMTREESDERLAVQIESAKFAKWTAYATTAVAICTMTVLLLAKRN